MLKHKLREVISSSSDSIFVPKWKSEGEKKKEKIYSIRILCLNVTTEFEQVIQVKAINRKICNGLEL